MNFSVSDALSGFISITKSIVKNVAPGIRPGPGSKQGFSGNSKHLSQAVRPALRVGGRAIEMGPAADGAGRISTLRVEILWEKAEVLTVPFFFQIFFGNESQGGRIHAVPKAGLRRSIIEHMSQV